MPDTRPPRPTTPHQPRNLPHIVPLRRVMGWLGEGSYCKSLSSLVVWQPLVSYLGFPGGNGGHFCCYQRICRNRHIQE